jgi:phage-related minor tail protein
MVLTRMLIAVPAVLLLLAAPVRADDAAQDNMEIVRTALRADKKALVATNLQLTDAEAKAFWPVYDRYEKDLLTAHNSLYQVVQEFAAHYDKLTNEKALELVERYLSAEEARAKVRRSYLKEISKVLPGLKVARFYQIENKIDAVVRYEMAGVIPLAKQ